MPKKFSDIKIKDKTLEKINKKIDRHEKKIEASKVKVKTKFEKHNEKLKDAKELDKVQAKNAAYKKKLNEKKFDEGIIKEQKLFKQQVQQRKLEKREEPARKREESAKQRKEAVDQQYEELFEKLIFVAPELADKMEYNNKAKDKAKIITDLKNEHFPQYHKENYAKTSEFQRKLIDDAKGVINLASENLEKIDKIAQEQEKIQSKADAKSIGQKMREKIKQKLKSLIPGRKTKQVDENKGTGRG